MMSKFLIQILLTAVVVGITQLFLPWWSLVIFSALIAFFFNYKYALTSYLAGFLSLFLLWSCYALWIYNSEHGSLLPEKIGELFGGLNGWGLVGIAGLIAGFLGGFSALTGTLGKRLLK